MTTELFNALTNGIAVFAFIKNNGELRIARGTLNYRIIGEATERVTAHQILVAETTNRYFDLDANEWRRVAMCGAQATLIGVMTSDTMVEIA